MYSTERRGRQSGIEEADMGSGAAGRNLIRNREESVVPTFATGRLM
jgi:hypothetical protein